MIRKTIPVIFIILMIVSSLVSGENKNTGPDKYYLYMDVLDYDSHLKKAIAYFFDRVLKKGDYLYLQTPNQLYDLSKYTVKGLPSEVRKRTLKVVKKDIESGSVLWRQVDNKRTLRDIKNTYEAKLLNAAKILGQTAGNNHLIMLYQIRYTYDHSESKSRNYNSMPIKVGEQYQMTFDSGKVLNACKANGIKFHFLYLNIDERPISNPQGDDKNRAIANATYSTSNTTSVDRIMSNTNAEGLGTIRTNNSSDVYKYYLELAKHSGGIHLTSKKAIAFFKKFR